jgi:glycosyltransferase involved in cell wall biosynthesis
LNAVDLTHFSPIGPRLDLDELSGLPAVGPNVVRVGLLATFARWKGHQTFLNALGLLPSSTPVRGYVLGGPVYETNASQLSLDELRAEAERLSLGTRVAFTGFVEDPALAIRSLDVVVHASTEPEPFGLVIAEAMACGKAVIVSQTGGTAEIITPGVDALVHAPGDATELARRIEELVDDAALRRRIGSGGRATAERSFTRRRLVGELVPIYQGLSSPKAQVSRLKAEGSGVRA